MKELICINCPMGCHLTVDDSDLNNIIVTGNTCPRGKTYGINEILHPLRMITSSVRVNDGKAKVVSIKTKEAIPKELIFECLDLLKDIEIEAPVHIGDIIVKNVLNTNVDIVATANVERI